MPETSSSHAVIVGAGVAGLTIAHQLVQSGRRVTVIERDTFVGGLGRSWHYGAFHFDVGPHRFHTENPRVADFIRQILQEEAIEIPRLSGARMFGKFHEWPLRPSVLFSMPIGMMFRCAFDLLHRPKVEGESFEADILNKYGRTLYEVFFKPYTEKFLFHSPADLHRDWARAGVNRAVIDKRASADTLWSLLKTTMLPKPVETTFLYPPTGVGRFSDRLDEIIRERGGRVVLGAPVEAVEARDGRIVSVTAGGERIACDQLVWTAPMPLINSLLGIEGITLNFLSTIFYNFEIKGPLKHNFQWTYHGGDESFSRVSAPTAFASTTAPAGTHGLCVEFTCRKGDERWSHPERFTERIIDDLVRTKTIDRREDILNVHVEPVPETYPIYTLDYLAQLTRSLKALGQYRNLLLAGRSGRFWYNNMDHSIGQGLTMSDKILRGQALAEIDDNDREFWAEASEAPANQ
ncbi:MAG: FAD-dependent oxidoreductase [Acidimicrobiia bacterium]|nr:FAD-dependent oxidoreductase [Acidimicrobiia bacterium]